jgi:hypothetical protein
MKVKEIGCEDVEWTELAQEMAAFGFCLQSVTCVHYALLIFDYFVLNLSTTCIHKTYVDNI